MAATDLNLAVVKRQVHGIRFGIYTDEETRSRSVLQITSSQAFDSLGESLPFGLYDPLLGPLDPYDNTACPSCGRNAVNCPGHTGHIELNFPVYQPLTFYKLLELLRLKCLACHGFRLGKTKLKIFAATFQLIDSGRLKEALELDGNCASLKSQLKEAKDPSQKTETKIDGEQLLANSIDQFLQQKLSNGNTSQEIQYQQQDENQLSYHERAVKRQTVKDFVAACKACNKCENCSAQSPKIRQDSYNKIFQCALPDSAKSLNISNRIKFRPAADKKNKDNRQGEETSGWVSDDTDIEDEDDMSDFEDNNSESRDSELKQNTSILDKDKTVKQDTFMHAIEVEAQARLTWRMEPFLCSVVCGSSHVVNGNKEGWGIFFMRAVPVPPSRFRPPNVMGHMTLEHGQTEYLNRILQMNDNLKKYAEIVKSIDNDQNMKQDGYTQSAIENTTAKADKMKAQEQFLTTSVELQTTVNCLIDSTKDPNASAADTVTNGIRQLLEKKDGLFRKNMMGKRVNFACRSVISPDPYIGTNEIGIPVHFAKTLTYPTPVTNLNIAEIQKLVIRGPHDYPGASWVEQPNGRKFELGKMEQQQREAIAARLLSSNGIVKVGRQLRNGDLVIVNRQPSLHKPSMMAHVVRVLHNPTQKTIRMHYANCNTYNADYDGDEMNCHFPQNDIARAESEIIAKTDLQYIVPTDGSPLRGLIQDHVDAGVKLTSKGTFLERWEYQQLIFAAMSSLTGLELIQSDVDIEMISPAILKPRELWTGKQVITTLLQHLRKGNSSDVMSNGTLPGISVERKAKTPNTAFGDSMEEHIVIIRDGELLRGVLDKAAFGATDFSLVHGVYEAYGPTKAGLLLNALGRLFTAYLQYYAGHSCRVEDLMLTTAADKYRRELVKSTYTMGARAAKAWSDADGGKVEIAPLSDQPNVNIPLKPVEVAATASNILRLLTGEEGEVNAAALDGYMQSQLNPLTSQIIKACLPNGLVVPFPENTFGLMVTTGAKGSTVNQSQVSCALGQQALEGRRVPRMSSGRTMPSFSPYDPNPRADGFIADRFLTGVRPQEYYFHCMAGREGLVDTAVKTSRSGYLQRCLVKHLEELKVSYDHTVRDGEGGIVQFLYGEDGIDPTKSAYLSGSPSTLEYIARNHRALKHNTTVLPNNTLEIANADCGRNKMLNKSTTALLVKGSFVKARKLRFGSEWRRGTLCRGWFSALVTKAYPDGLHFDIHFVKDGSQAIHVPLEVQFSYAGGKTTAAASRICTIIKPSVPDPILSDCAPERGNHRIGSSGACVSEKIAHSTVDVIANNAKLKSVMKTIGLTAEELKSVVAAKFGSALCAPGEAVGCIAGQSIGEPSTQMTLNTFHLAGSGANVTLGIPRLREIIMTASKQLKTPTMSVPLHPSVTETESTRLTHFFTELALMELIASHDGITVIESIQQGSAGTWERAYQIKLKLHSLERIREAFELTVEEIALIVSSKFLPNIIRIMKIELKRSNSDSDFTVSVKGGDAVDFVSDQKVTKSSKKTKGESNEGSDDEDDIEEDNDAVGDEDGVVASRFGPKKEMSSYGDMDEEDKECLSLENKSDQNLLLDNNAQEAIVKEDDENVDNSKIDSILFSEKVHIDEDENTLVLQPLQVDPSARPLLMIDLVERAAARTLVRSRPGINQAFINEEEGRDRCLQTAGCNFTELWNLVEVDHSLISSNDIWAVCCSYGVEAARMTIVEQIRSVFAVYGISVDPRHLTLIADYMTYNGGFKAMSRLGMAEASSSFLQMTFETTANFMIDAALNNRYEPMMSPSANIVVGRPIRHGTGAFDCIVK